MKITPFILTLLYCFLLVSGRAYGTGERTITIGGASSWNSVELRQGITEANQIRPHPVLALFGADNGHSRDAFLDLHLSFDERRPQAWTDSRGRYDVFVSAEVGTASAPWSRWGDGAALFTRSGAGSPMGASEPLLLIPRSNALFAPGSRIRDFSIEFWLFPQNLETGEQVLSWSASKPQGGMFIQQQLSGTITQGRLRWTFENFFFAPGEQTSKRMTLSGPLLIPRTWSHHLIRFDADLGILEYLVDGRLEALEYATSTGREGGEVYTPVIGLNSRMTLGRRFSGMMDEFRIFRSFHEDISLSKLPTRGGRVETRTLDLGHTNSRVRRLEAFGGRTTTTAGRTRNEYAGNGALRFSDHSEINFFIRTSNHPHRWNDVPWLPVQPGTELADSFRGRYVQIAAEFFPSWDGGTSPYLSELRLVFNAAEPPPPPTMLTAVPLNGAVELSWRPSASRDVGGYMVFYGTARGEYFGSHAILDSVPSASPIDVGNRTSVRIEGLNNGTLYFFAVAAYRRLEEGMFIPEPGEFSREVAARPLLRSTGE